MCEFFQFPSIHKWTVSIHTISANQNIEQKKSVSFVFPFFSFLKLKSKNEEFVNEEKEEK